MSNFNLAVSDAGESRASNDTAHGYADHTQTNLEWGRLSPILGNRWESFTLSGKRASLFTEFDLNQDNKVNDQTSSHQTPVAFAYPILGVEL